MVCVFQTDPKNPGKYFLAQHGSSGTPRMHSPVEIHYIGFETARILHLPSNSDNPPLFISIFSTSRQASKPSILASHYPWTLHAALFQAYLLPSSMLWILACQYTQSVIFQTWHFVVQSWLIPLGLSYCRNLCLISLWRPSLNCHYCPIQCQPILRKKVSTTHLP